MKLPFTPAALLATTLSVLLAGAAQAQATVRALTPTRNALAAPRATNVTATLNQLLRNTPATQQALRVFSQQAGGRKAGTATVSGNQLTFDPTTDFQAGETVWATLTGAAQGSDGAAAASQVFQFTTATAPSFGTFEDGQRVVTNRLLAQVVTGDMNGDGKLDIVTADGGQGTLSIRINNGDGTFLDPTTPGGGQYDIFAGGVIRSVALGDVDGDGDLDIAYTTYLRENLPGAAGIFLNNGDATFTRATGVSLGAGPRQVILGDLDGDGDLDLVASSTGTSANNRYAPIVNVRLNNGQGLFSGTQDVILPNAYLALGDVDDDGDLDLLTTGYNYLTGNQITTLSRNDGQGMFGAFQVASSAIYAQKLIVQDLDADGDLDLLVLENSGSVSVQFNDGAGVFTTRQTLPSRLANDTYESIGFVAGDLEGDGDTDLLIGNGPIVSKWVNNGAGVFSEAQPAATVTDKAVSLALGDVDADGDLDILVGQSGQENSQVAVQLNENPSAPPVPLSTYRLNAGGSALSTSRGAFTADQYYSPNSRTAATSAAIAGTPDPALYQTERYSTDGMLRYAVPVANGTYTVVLRFAEIYWTQAGQRVFDVALEGAKKLTNYDIVREVGPRVATSKTFVVTVTDGVLNVDLSVPYLTGGRDQAKLSALEIVPFAPTYQLNAGGPALTTSRGRFAADQYYNDSSRTAIVSNAIAGTADQRLYQTERYSLRGLLQYALPVPNGAYTVVLHFAEIYWTQPGQRVFDVDLEGQKRLTNYDIVAKVGPLTATTETFTVTVTDGVLNVDLSVPYLTGGRDQAKLSALEVLGVDASSPALSAYAVAASATLAENPSPGALQAYPNPSRGDFTLTLTSAASQAATLTLTDRLGRVVQQQAVPLQVGTNQVVVRTSGLSMGLYQCTLRTADGQRQSQKVALQP